MTPENINPVQWNQSIGLARQSCARIFRDGGMPADALVAFGVRSEQANLDWSQAVELIARSLCAMPVVRRAA